MRIADELGVEVDIVNYMKDPLDAATLREIIGKLEDPPTDLVRRDSTFEKLELTDADVETVDQIVEVLTRGGTMTFLADQSAGPKGCWIDFFGRPASAHKAIALLALDNDAPIAVTSVKRLGKPLLFEMRVAAVADPRDVGDGLSSVHDLTQWYSSRLEELIREAPEQYWWLHRRWKDTRKQRRLQKKKAKKAA